MLATQSKQVKVLYDPQNIITSSYFLRGFPNHQGGPGNPSAPIGFNGKSITNIRSRSAMRGAEFHGNTRRDSTTRILSILSKGVCSFSIVRQAMQTKFGITLQHWILWERIFFSLPCDKYWSNLQTVSELKFCFDFKMSVLRVIFC